MFTNIEGSASLQGPAFIITHLYCLSFSQPCHGLFEDYGRNYPNGEIQSTLRQKWRKAYLIPWIYHLPRKYSWKLWKTPQCSIKSDATISLDSCQSFFVLITKLLLKLPLPILLNEFFLSGGQELRRNFTLFCPLPSSLQPLQLHLNNLTDVLLQTSSVSRWMALTFHWSTSCRNTLT